jgi:hypothetical protein
VWSSDGRYIAWQAIRGDKPDIYRKSADGSGVDEPLSAPKEPNNLTDWTHSGHLIFTMGGDVYAMPVNPDAAGNRTPVPVVQSPAGELGAYVSPDNAIAYMSNETGRQGNLRPAICRRWKHDDRQVDGLERHAWNGALALRQQGAHVRRS